MQFCLRTLLIALALLPPLIAVTWSHYAAWRAEQARLAAQAEYEAALTFVVPELTVNPPDQQGAQAEPEAVFSFVIGTTR